MQAPIETAGEPPKLTATMSPPADPVPQRADSANEEERITARLLDAAFEEFSSYGLRRTSMENVAERAGLARSTLYRRFSNKRELARAVAMRRSRAVLVDLVRVVERLPTVEARLVEAFVLGITRARTDGLLLRLLEAEPETVLPYFTTHSDIALGVGRGFLAEQLRRSPGPPIKGDPDAAAELIFRLATSIMLAPRGHIPLDSEDDLRAFARAYLVPLLHVPGPAGQR
jgi:AcrR family transcriptional regulator